MKLVLFPNKILKTVCNPVEVNQKNVARAIDMLRIMKQHRGVGLSACQVGWPARVFVMNCGTPYIFFNPRVLEASEVKISMQEACLSFPGLTLEIERSESVSLEWQDIKGVTKTKTFTGMEARCALHELEHLEGITFDAR